MHNRLKLDGWQVSLCDPTWHAGSRSSAMLLAQTALLLYFLYLLDAECGRQAVVVSPSLTTLSHICHLQLFVNYGSTIVVCLPHLANVDAPWPKFV